MILLATSNKKALARWLAAIPENKAVLPVTSYSELCKAMESHPEPLAIVHFSLEGISGIEDIKRLHGTFSNSKVMMLEDVPNESRGVELIKSGILGYGNTYLDPSMLSEAIKVIEMGEIWISKRIIQWLANHCNQEPSDIDLFNHDRLFRELTPSEISIMNYLLDGDSNKSIARKLGITERTVKAHLTSIYRKTGIKDRLHLVLAASGKQY
jgi:DNA-binding NarL/FixJ family response regulator